MKATSKQKQKICCNDWYSISTLEKANIKHKKFKPFPEVLSVCEVRNS